MNVLHHFIRNVIAFRHGKPNPQAASRDARDGLEVGLVAYLPARMFEAQDLAAKANRFFSIRDRVAGMEES